MPNKVTPINKKAAYRIEASAEGVSTIWIYSFIGEDYWTGVSAEDIHEDLAALNGGDVLVRINSRGGDVVEGFIMMNAFAEYEGKVDFQIDGWALSMASVIPVGGKGVIKMASNGRYMIHGPRMPNYGTEEDMLDAATMLKEYKLQMSQVYAAKTGKTEEEFITLLSDRSDHWYTAEQALEMGFIDEVIEAQKVAACGDAGEIKTFGDIPAEIVAELNALTEPDDTQDNIDNDPDVDADGTQDDIDNEPDVDADDTQGDIDNESDVDPIKAAKAAEKCRVKAIITACSDAGLDHLAANYIEKDYPIETAQDLLQEIKAGMENPSAPRDQSIIVSQQKTSESSSVWGDAHKIANVKVK